jgi:hypothetical protein
MSRFGSPSGPQPRQANPGSAVSFTGFELSAFDLTPASPYWLDGFLFWGGELGDRDMRRCLEKVEPFSDADDTLAVVIPRNALALFKTMEFFRDFADTNEFIGIVTEELGWGSSQCTKRLIDRYVKARAAYLENDNGVAYPHLPPDASNISRAICPLVDWYSSLNLHPPLFAMTDAQEEHAVTTRAVWKRMYGECPRALLTDIPASAANIHKKDGDNGSDDLSGAEQEAVDSRGVLNREDVEMQDAQTAIHIPMHASEQTGPAPTHQSESPPRGQDIDAHRAKSTGHLMASPKGKEKALPTTQSSSHARNRARLGTGHMDAAINPSRMKHFMPADYNAAHPGTTSNP